MTYSSCGRGDVQHSDDWDDRIIKQLSGHPPPGLQSRSRGDRPSVGKLMTMSSPTVGGPRPGREGRISCRSDPAPSGHGRPADWRPLVSPQRELHNLLMIDLFAKTRAAGSHWATGIWLQEREPRKLQSLWDRTALVVPGFCTGSTLLDHCPWQAVPKGYMLWRADDDAFNFSVVTAMREGMDSVFRMTGTARSMTSSQARAGRQRTTLCAAASRQLWQK